MKFSADALDWKPGPRPTLSFLDTWLCQNDNALVHLATQDGDTSESVLLHIAFRTRKDAADVLAAMRENSMPYQARGRPTRPVAQIFIQLSDGMVLELEAPMSGPLEAARDYQ